MELIVPIQTRYKGYLFRSRLEARWAVFLDELGVKWEYEKEGYELKYLGKYLPDFYIPRYNSFLEIKPAGYPSNVDQMKCIELSMLTGKKVVLAAGDPLEHQAFFYSQGPNEFMRNSIEFTSVGMCPHFMHGKGPNSSTYPELDIYIHADAALRARSARFEHGESGAV